MNLLLRNWIIEHRTSLVELKYPSIKKTIREVFPEENFTQKEVYDILFPEKVHPCHSSVFVKFSVGYKNCQKNCKCYLERLSKKVSDSKLSYSDEQKNRILEKRKKTLNTRYGVDNIFQLDDIKNVSRETKLAKYGDPTYRNNEQIKATCHERYGVDNPMKASLIRENYYRDFYNRNFDEITKKIKQTKQEKYGDPNFSNRTQAASTNQLRYGVDNPAKSDDVKDKISKKLRKRSYEHHPMKYQMTPLFSIDDYVPGKKMLWKCNKCDNTIEGMVWNGKFSRCTQCFPYSTSLEEQELYEFVREALPKDIEIIRNTRDIITPKELDIYIPELSLAIEYAGLYWHSDRTKAPEYHINKYKQCKEKGIRLLTIYSDDFTERRDIIKSRLNSILGCSINRLYARKCEVRTVSSQESKDFLNRTHIQGWCVSKYRLGLYYDDNLVSLMTFSNSRFTKNEYELLRYSSENNTTVVGGASKLLKAFLSLTTDNKKNIVTYSSNDFGYTEFYKNLGFDHISETAPGYAYYNFYNSGNRKISRNAVQKHKIILEEHELLMTEKEIMKSRGYERVYDCGNNKWLFRWS